MGFQLRFRVSSSLILRTIALWRKIGNGFSPFLCVFLHLPAEITGQLKPRVEIGACPPPIFADIFACRG